MSLGITALTVIVIKHQALILDSWEIIVISMTFVVRTTLLTTGSSFIKLISTLLFHLLLLLLGLHSFFSSSRQFCWLSNAEAEPSVRSISTLRALSVSSANFEVVIVLDHFHDRLWDLIDMYPAGVIDVDIAVTALSVVAIVVLTPW